MIFHLPIDWEGAYSGIKKPSNQKIPYFSISLFDEELE
jgi:hypothetical protein